MKRQFHSFFVIARFYGMQAMVVGEKIGGSEKTERKIGVVSSAPFSRNIWLVAPISRVPVG